MLEHLLTRAVNANPRPHGMIITWEIQEASIADSASSSLAVMAHRAPTSLPTACSVSVAFSAHQTVAFSRVASPIAVGRTPG